MEGFDAEQNGPEPRSLESANDDGVHRIRARVDSERDAERQRLDSFTQLQDPVLAGPTWHDEIGVGELKIRDAVGFVAADAVLRPLRPIGRNCCRGTVLLRRAGRNSAEAAPRITSPARTKSSSGRPLAHRPELARTNRRTMGPVRTNFAIAPRQLVTDDIPAYVERDFRLYPSSPARTPDGPPDLPQLTLRRLGRSNPPVHWRAGDRPPSRPQRRQLR